MLPPRHIEPLLLGLGHDGFHWAEMLRTDLPDVIIIPSVWIDDRHWPTMLPPYLFESRSCFGCFDRMVDVKPSLRVKKGKYTVKEYCAPLIHTPEKNSKAQRLPAMPIISNVPFLARSVVKRPHKQFLKEMIKG